MVNAATDYPCVYNSATGTLTVRGHGSINFSALVEELNHTVGMLNPGQRITLGPGQLSSGGIASEFPSVFDRQQAERNMALGRMLLDKIVLQFSEENVSSLAL